MSESIHHNGIVEKIEDSTIFVRIIQQSACSGCHAQAICSASDKKEKIIEVPDASGQFHVGEVVAVCGQSRTGLQAVLLAFVVPLVLIVAGITAGTLLQWQETASAVGGLMLLILYYYALYLLRDKLKRRFIFTLEKLNQS